MVEVVAVAAVDLVVDLVVVVGDLVVVVVVPLETDAVEAEH